MKKKKLTLSRETLRRLDEKDLRPAAGGTTTPNTVSECVCSYTNCSYVCFMDPTCG
jgi:hypothetical protein